MPAVNSLTLKIRNQDEPEEELSIQKEDSNLEDDESIEKNTNTPIKDTINKIIDNQKEKRSGGLRRTINFLLDKESSGILNFYSNYDGIEKETKMLILKSTKIDVNDDGENDISVQFLPYPSIEKANKLIALCINFRLKITKLDGFVNPTNYFEGYAQYNFPGLLSRQLKDNRVSFGYRTEELEGVPDQFTIIYKFLPHLFHISKKAEHKLLMDPGSSDSNHKLSTIFSYLDKDGETINSEKKWIISYDPVVKTEINFRGLDDSFGGILELESTSESKVVIDRIINSAGTVKRSGATIDKMSSFSFELKLTPLSKDEGKVEYIKHNGNPTYVSIYAEHNNTCYIYAKGLSDHSLISWNFALEGHIEFNNYDKKVEEIGIRNSISQEQLTASIYFTNLPSIATLNWKLKPHADKTLELQSHRAGVSGHLYSEDFLGTGLKLQIDASPQNDLHFAMYYSPSQGIFQIKKMPSQIELNIHAEYNSNIFDFRGVVSQTADKLLEINFDNEDETTNIIISCEKTLEIKGLYLLIQTENGDYGLKAEHLILKNGGSFTACYTITVDEKNFSCVGFIESTGGIYSKSLSINVKGNWYKLPDADTENHWRYDFEIRGTFDIEFVIADDFSWGYILIYGACILNIDATFSHNGRQGGVKGTVYFNKPDDVLNISWVTINDEKVFNIDGTAVLGLYNFNLWFDDVIELDIPEFYGYLDIKDVSQSSGDITFTIANVNSSFAFNANFSSQAIDDIQINVGFDIEFERESEIEFIISWENYNLTSLGFVLNSDVKISIINLVINIDIFGKLIQINGKELLFLNQGSIDFDICSDSASFDFLVDTNLDRWNIYYYNSSELIFELNNLSLELNGNIGIYLPYDFFNYTPYIELIDAILDLHIDNLNIPAVSRALDEDNPLPFGEIALAINVTGAAQISLLDISIDDEILYFELDDSELLIKWIGASIGIDSTNGVLTIENFLFENFPFFGMLSIRDLYITGRTRIDFTLGMGLGQYPWWLNLSVNNDPNSYLVFDQIFLKFPFGGISIPIKFYDSSFSEGIFSVTARLAFGIKAEIVEGLNIDSFGLSIIIPGDLIGDVLNLPYVPDPAELKVYIEDPIEYLLINLDDGSLQDVEEEEIDVFVELDTHDTTVTLDFYLILNKEFFNYVIEVWNDMFGDDISYFEYDVGIRIDNCKLRADGFAIHRLNKLLAMEFDQAYMEGSLNFQSGGTLWLLINGTWRPYDNPGEGTEIEISPGHFGVYIDNTIVLGQTFHLFNTEIRIRGVIQANNCRFDIWWDKELGSYTFRADADAIISDFLFEVDNVIHVYFEYLNLEEYLFIDYMPGRLVLDSYGAMEFKGDCEFEFLSNFIVLNGNFDIERARERTINLTVDFDPSNMELYHVSLYLKRDASLTITDFTLNILGMQIEWDRYYVHRSSELELDWFKNDLSQDFEVKIENSKTYELEQFFLNHTSVYMLNCNGCTGGKIDRIDILWTVLRIELINIETNLVGEGAFIGIVSSAGITGFANFEFQFDRHILVRGFFFTPYRPWLRSIVSQFGFITFEKYASTKVKMDFYIDLAQSKFELGYAQVDRSVTGTLDGLVIYGLNNNFELILDRLSWERHMHLLFCTNTTEHYNGGADGAYVEFSFDYLTEFRDETGNQKSFYIKFFGVKFSVGDITNSGSLDLQAWPHRGYWIIESESSRDINHLVFDYAGPNADLELYIQNIHKTGDGTIFMDLMDDLTVVKETTNDLGFLSSFKGVIKAEDVSSFQITNLEVYFEAYDIVIFPTDDSYPIFIDGDVTINMPDLHVSGATNFELGWAEDFLKTDFGGSGAASAGWTFTITDNINSIQWSSDATITGAISVSFCPGFIPHLQDLSTGLVAISSDSAGSIDCNLVKNGKEVFDIDMTINSGDTNIVAKIENKIIFRAEPSSSGISATLNSFIIDLEIFSMEIDDFTINSDTLALEIGFQESLSFNFISSGQCSLKSFEAGYDFTNPQGSRGIDYLIEQLFGEGFDTNLIPESFEIVLKGPNNGIINKGPGQLVGEIANNPIRASFHNTISGLDIEIGIKIGLLKIINNGLIPKLNDVFGHHIFPIDYIGDVEISIIIENFADEAIFNFDMSEGFYADCTGGTLADLIRIRLLLPDGPFAIPGVGFDFYEPKIDDLSLNWAGIGDQSFKTIFNIISNAAESIGKDEHIFFLIYESGIWKNAFEVEFDINFDKQGYFNYDRYEDLNCDAIKNVAAYFQLPIRNRVSNVDIDLNMPSRVDFEWDLNGPECYFRFNTYGELLTGDFWVWRGNDRYEPLGLIGGVRLLSNRLIGTDSGGFEITYDKNNPILTAEANGNIIQGGERLKVWVAINGVWYQIYGDKELLVELNVTAEVNLTYPLVFEGEVKSGGQEPYDYYVDVNYDGVNPTFDSEKRNIYSKIQEFSHEYTEEGFYTIYLRVIDNNGVIGNDTASVRVIGDETEFNVNLEDEYAGDPHYPIKFIPSVSNEEEPVYFGWDFGDGYTLEPGLGTDEIPDHTHMKHGQILTTGTYKEPEHLYSKGNYIITVDATDNTGATSNDTALVDVGIGHWSYSLKASYYDEFGDFKDIPLFRSTENKPRPILYRGTPYTYTVLLNGYTEYGWDVEIYFGVDPLRVVTAPGYNKIATFEHTFPVLGNDNEGEIVLFIEENLPNGRYGSSIYPYELKDYQATLVKGNVYDYNNQHIGIGVEGATVSTVGDNGWYPDSDITDNTGEFEIDTHQYETTITIEKEGYITQSQDFLIPCGDSPGELEILLKRPVTIDILWEGKKLYENTEFSVRLSNGADDTPISGANIVYKYLGFGNQIWYPITSGVTDENGIVTFTSKEVTGNLRNKVPSKVIVTQQGKDYEGQFEVHDGQNSGPATPNRPYLQIGTKKYNDNYKYEDGKVNTVYNFYTESIDPNTGDKLQFGWDWNGDGTVDEWTEEKNSGDEFATSHTWIEPGTYNIKVKARDSQMYQSQWSDSFEMTVEIYVDAGIGLIAGTKLRLPNDNTINIQDSLDHLVKGYDLNIVDFTNNYISVVEEVTAQSYIIITLKNGYQLKALKDQKFLVSAGRAFKKAIDIDIDDELYGKYGVRHEIQDITFVEQDATFYRLSISGTHNVWIKTNSEDYVLANAYPGSPPEEDLYPGFTGSTIIKCVGGNPDLPLYSDDLESGTQVAGLYEDSNSIIIPIREVLGKSQTGSTSFKSYTITTSNGKSITAGNGQKFFTPYGVKTLNELFIGDSVYVYDGQWKLYKSVTIVSKQEQTATSYYILTISDNRFCFANGFCVFCNDADTNRAPEEPSNPSPVDSSTWMPADLTLSWDCSDQDGDPITYDVYLGTDPTPSTGSLVSEGQTGTSYSVSDLDYLTVYYWKIVAHDDKGHTREGPIWQFETMNEPPENNYPPNKPEIRKVSSGNSFQVGETVEFEVRGTDDDPGNILYFKIDWQIPYDFPTWTTRPYTKGAWHSFEQSWDDPGTYQLRVKSKDADYESDWSDPITVTITHNQPTASFTMPDEVQWGVPFTCDASASHDNDEDGHKIANYKWQKLWNGIWLNIISSPNAVTCQITFYDPPEGGSEQREVKLIVTDDEGAEVEKVKITTCPLEPGPI
jgi:hypothetical protein